MSLTSLEKLDEVVKIQSAVGNAMSNEYMRGMANGLILAQHIMHDKTGEVEYFNPDGSRVPNIPVYDEDNAAKLD